MTRDKSSERRKNIAILGKALVRYERDMQALDIQLSKATTARRLALCDIAQWRADSRVAEAYYLVTHRYNSVYKCKLVTPAEARHFCQHLTNQEALGTSEIED